MKRTTEEIKQDIISATIELIKSSNGNVGEITTRVIAEKANVGVGLINYHFQTKENLIEICVQQIIGKVVSSFRPIGGENFIGIERLINAASQVFDFLFENPAVSRISILGDFHSPALDDNTIKTMQGFEHLLSDCKMEANEKRIFSFALTTVMQTAFLRKENIKELFGYDLNTKSNRENFIINLVKAIYEGAKHGSGDKK